MRVGLIDVDSHNFPNLPLMKISAFHKNAGDQVGFVINGGTYDKVYISKVFTESKEPDIDYQAPWVVRGGSGYDLKNQLADEIEHVYPDYSLYPQFNYALGWLTRGCPHCDHPFCITPEKDGRISRKVADLSEFWRGQKEIKLLDQNLLACKDRYDLLNQLQQSGAWVEFNGGMDIRFVTTEVAEILSTLKVKIHHFAWDNPKERLENHFEWLRPFLPQKDQNITVYVLVNYWSTIDEDLKRIYFLRDHGYQPFVMIYDKQKFVDSRGRWLPSVLDQYTKDERVHFKMCQHLQRWCNNRMIFRTTLNFNDYLKTFWRETKWTS